MANAILFACNMNSVRSPMAAALLRKMSDNTATVDSAGVYEGGLDPFVEIVMEEIGVSLADHAPRAISDIDLSAVDTVIALTPEAAVEARKFLPRESIEFWDIENPSDERGGRDAIIDAYRRVREEITAKLRRRFPEICKNT
ncbi:MAG: hypothetical protein AAGB02_08735 [Pseudomonadota bacterium]